jgi:hypothetical protein
MAAITKKGHAMKLRELDKSEWILRFHFLSWGAPVNECGYNPLDKGASFKVSE